MMMFVSISGRRGVRLKESCKKSNSRTYLAGRGGEGAALDSTEDLACGEHDGGCGGCRDDGAGLEIDGREDEKTKKTMEEAVTITITISTRFFRAPSDNVKSCRSCPLPTASCSFFRRRPR